MRVPSIGLPLDERLIVREGYRLAEKMMANYREPPGVIEMVRAWLGRCGQTLATRYRSLSRD